jgi:hypothetical protein
VLEAFEQVRAMLILENIPEAATPELFTREGIDAADVVLVRPM